MWKKPLVFSSFYYQLPTATPVKLLTAKLLTPKKGKLLFSSQLFASEKHFLRYVQNITPYFSVHSQSDILHGHVFASLNKKKGQLLFSPPLLQVKSTSGICANYHTIFFRALSSRHLAQSCLYITK